MLVVFLWAPNLILFFCLILDLFKRFHRYDVSDPNGSVLEGITLSVQVRKRKTILYDVVCEILLKKKKNLIKTEIRFVVARRRRGN